MSTIYLAGKILDKDNWHGWRANAEAHLKASGHIVLCPECDTSNSLLLNQGTKDWAAQIVKNDFNLVRTVDVLLVEASEASEGTAMEVMYAKQLGITNIMFGLDRNSAFMIHFGDFFLPDLESALKFIDDNH